MLNTNLNLNSIRKDNNIIFLNSQTNLNCPNLSFTGKDVLQISQNPTLKIPSIYSKGKHVEVVSFGLNSEKTQQGRGIFIHMSNLPPSSPNSPIGELVGEQTDQFINFLAKSKQNIWSINPLTPFGEDLSPYNASSRFERSPYYINQQRFFDSDYQLLGQNDKAFFDQHKYERKDNNSFNPDEFTLDDCKKHKDPVFKRAYENFKAAGDNHVLRPEFNAYINEEGAKWLNSAAVFATIQGYLIKNAQETKYSYINYDKSIAKLDKACRTKDKSGKETFNEEKFEARKKVIDRIYEKNNPYYKERHDDWTTWRKELITLPENKTYENANTLEEKLDVLNKILPDDKKLRSEDRQTAEQFRFDQFLFDHQFKELKVKLDNNNIRMLVDLAYAVSPAGSDVWANKEIVMLDKKDHSPAVMTGCMPEGAYPWTQMWGQAVWNYESNAFWKYSEDVMNKTLGETGALRLDHFGGLINRGAIPTKLKGDDIVDTLVDAYTSGKNNYLKSDLVKMFENPSDQINEKMGGSFDVKNATPDSVKQVLTKIFKPDEEYKTQEITKKREEGGKYGLISFWKDEWLEDVYSKRNKLTGENNLIDTYLRIAAEKGLNLKNTFVLEDLGGVGTTKLFQETFLPAKYSPKTDGLKLTTVAQGCINEAKGTSYQELFSFFRTPITYGIGDPHDGNIHNPYGFARDKNDKGFYPKTTTVVTCNHDMETFLQTIKRLLEDKTRTKKYKQKPSRRRNETDHFRKLMKKYDIKAPVLVNGRVSNDDARKTMQDVIEKYFYNDKIGFKNVIISFNDAIGVMRRPNCPGNENKGKIPANCDKFFGYDLAPPELFPYKYDKDPREAMKKAQSKTWLWGFTFKPNFLTTTKEQGGYKERADEFISMQERINQNKERLQNVN